MKCHKLWKKSKRGGGVKAKIKIVYISRKTKVAILGYISSREQLSVTFLSLGSGLRSQVGCQVDLAVK